MHALPMHVSVVQTLPSSHMAATSLAFFKVNVHPSIESHVSVVQMSMSSHTTGKLSHNPVAGLHWNVLHGVFAGQLTDTVLMQSLLAHVSVVHALLSLQSVAISPDVLFSMAHPVAGLHVPFWQIFGGVGPGHVMAVYTHELFAHVSVVHALLSLQITAISSRPFGSRPQPVVGEQTGFKQMSDDVHDELMFVNTQPVCALQLSSVHALESSHGIVV